MTAQLAVRATRKRADAAQQISSGSPIGMVALHVLDAWRKSKRNGIVFISQDERRSEQLGAILFALMPECDVMVLPAPDVLPCDGLEPSREISGRRASVLRRLAERPDRALLVATAEALLKRVPPRSSWADNSLRLQKGDIFDEDALKDFLVRAGYALDERAEIPGTALFLGQVVELYPAGSLGPVRIDHADGKICAMGFYELETQRVVSETDVVVLDTVSEWQQSTADETKPANGHAASSSVFDYLPSAMLIVDAGVEARVESWFGQLHEPENVAQTKGQFVTADEWRTAPRKRKAAVLPRSAPFESVPVFVRARNPTRSLREFVAEQQALGQQIVFTAATEGDLRTIERRAGSRAERAATWEAALGNKGAASLTVDLDRGFVDRERKVTVITAADVLGSRATHQMPMGPAAKVHPQSDATLRPGDVIIHIDRGIAVLDGLEAVSAEGMPQAEMLRLKFANEATVLAPIGELRSIWRYSSDPTSIILDKADGTSWEKRRAEVERDIRETASHLSKLAGERRKREAAKLVPPAAEYERFVSRFRYFATPDQSRAVEDVLADLASGQQLDRLVCGDVGYGKTEAALRAAAAVVFAGKQVAIAVPTTVLARQHVQTFRRRFEPFGIEVGELSRFASAKDARLVKKGLADGTLRLVIGTHALAAKGVRFSDLGLLVIDEEQRFGLADKIKLTKLGVGVHLLTMTATPIPRTLSQTYAGIRPISVISTPPARRVPIKTVVEPLDDVVVAAALRREQRRGGQSFFVCPRIEDIGPMRERLGTIVPELKITAVHGKMSPRDIDAAMLEFVSGETEVLITTNIIETGLDIPRANTIIVWRPDKFGLAQLHQLRGRVGRGSTRAFALFLTDPDARLSSTAIRRLEILVDSETTGAGLDISHSDMDLRGVGDLLSERQSGHAKLVGPSLLRHLLDRALRGESDRDLSSEARPQLHLERPPFLPTSYIQDEATRLETYARISKCASEDELDQIEDQMIERFGEPPAEAADFLEQARMEVDCLTLGIVSINAGPDSIAATLDDHGPCRGKRGRCASKKLQVKDGRLVYERPSSRSERFTAVREFLDILAEGRGGSVAGDGMGRAVAIDDGKN